jgi:hypothetical protein
MVDALIPFVITPPHGDQIKERYSTFRIPFAHALTRRMLRPEFDLGEVGDLLAIPRQFRFDDHL